MMESKEDILIIVNKNCGNQQADTVLNNSVLPYLSHICVGYQLIYTQKNKNDIADFKNHPGIRNIRVFSKFMIIGGDGTVFVEAVDSFQITTSDVVLRLRNFKTLGRDRWAGSQKSV